MPGEDRPVGGPDAPGKLSSREGPLGCSVGPIHVPLHKTLLRPRSQLAGGCHRLFFHPYTLVCKLVPEPGGSVVQCTSGEGGAGWGFVAQGWSGNGFPVPGSDQGSS